MHVPNGYSVSIFQMDYRGFNSLPPGGRSVFNVEYFWAGQRGPRMSRTWNGRLDGEYLVSHGLIAGAMVWSRCGEQVTLRAHTGMATYSNSRGEQALSTVDSLDASAGLVYHLQFRRCPYATDMAEAVEM